MTERRSKRDGVKVRGSWLASEEGNLKFGLFGQRGSEGKEGRC